MPRMRVIKLDCTACRYYRLEGFSHRCILKDNRYNNWLGQMYKEHPDQKNYNGECKDYEEMD